MYSVTKVFRVPIGHRLSKHKGLCKNIHGHNLKVEVRVSSKTLNENEMVVDFSVIKKVVGKFLDEWDHSLLLNRNDTEVEESVKLHSKCFLITGDPTAENLCSFLLWRIENDFQSMGLRNILNIDFIRIWENDDSYAEYSRSE